MADTDTPPLAGFSVKPFCELRVIEVTGSTAGAYAAKLFADHGATVLKVEPPGGDPLRQAGPAVDGSGSLFAYANTGKCSLVLDVRGRDEDRERLFALAKGADVLIESSSPAPLVPLSADLDLSGLVRLYVSPFGLDGPYAGFSSSDFTDFAIAGHMYINGDPDRPPLQGPPHQSEYCSGIHAFIGAMAALWARERTGLGQAVDVSHFEVMASIDQYLVTMWTHSQHIERRVGNATPGPWHPNTHVRCQDGQLSITSGGRPPREAMVSVMGLDHLWDDPRFADPASLLRHRDEFSEAIAPWFLENKISDVVELFQAVRVPAGPVRGLHDVLDYEQVRARGFWSVPDSSSGVRYPRGAFVISGHPTVITVAPALGDADAETLARFEAASSAEARSAEARSAEARSAEARSDEARSDDARAGAELPAGPLDGIRILDLGAGWAGPMCGRILGDLGADIVRIEPPWARGPRVVSGEYAAAFHLYPDDDPGEQPWNREGMAALWSRNRRAVCVRFDRPEGRQILEELIRRSDLLMENYSPRVLPNLGLSFERLQELNPPLVYLHLPGYGSTGPDANFVALGPTVEAASGLCALQGYPDRGRHRQGYAIPDAINGMSGAAAALIGLWHRAADPGHRGVDVEGAQLEATVCFAGEALLAAQVTGEEPVLYGNRHPVFAPQGVYPAAGDDAWIAITVQSEDEWRELSALAGLPGELAGLSSPEGRRARHDEIDEALSAWTARHEHRELMVRCQERGVTAAAVLNSSELVDDPQLSARGLYQMLAGNGCGPFPSHGIPMHFSATPPTYRIARPALGQFNDEVLGELGHGADEIAALREAGVICDAPLAEIPPA
jgi:crotonobetainyl-CoA:carnitine CoA-transferase CaiB-like acyl-CoA transferase